jgi:hypothetical protein
MNPEESLRIHKCYGIKDSLSYVIRKNKVIDGIGKNCRSVDTYKYNKEMLHKAVSFASCKFPYKSSHKEQHPVVGCVTHALGKVHNKRIGAVVIGVI